jgi:hypothetical protein
MEETAHRKRTMLDPAQFESFHELFDPVEESFRASCADEARREVLEERWGRGYGGSGGGEVG